MHIIHSRSLERKAKQKTQETMLCYGLPCYLTPDLDNVFVSNNTLGKALLSCGLDRIILRAQRSGTDLNSASKSNITVTCACVHRTFFLVYYVYNG